MAFRRARSPFPAKDADTRKTESEATDLESSRTATNHRREEDHYLPPVGAGNHISLADVDQVGIEIRGLKVTINTKPSLLRPSTYGELVRQAFRREKGGNECELDPGSPEHTKTLIHLTSASIRPGTLTAIIGGSGSGKTTLLNTLSERVSSSRVKQTGSVSFNGEEGVGSCRNAYVVQQDILLPSLTVRETLAYAAELRLPPPCTEVERRRVVDEVIMELGLKECANTRLGDSLHKGASGGEKRRSSIGVQLLSNPSVLFLDEPTTGLDATSAFHLVRTLKNLAAKGRTVITTIHQPRSEIWDLFDNVAVLSRGSPVFIGSRDRCVPWLEGMGLKMGEFVNPAEWVVDCAAIDTRTRQMEEKTSARVTRLKDAWCRETERLFRPPVITNITERRPSPTMTKLKETMKKSTYHAPFAQQLRVLTSRTVKVTYRDPMGMAASILEAVLMGILCGYVFYDLPRSLSGIRSRQGAIYTAAALQGYLFLIFEVYRLTVDMPMFDSENGEGFVSALPWILSRRLARFLSEDLPVPFLFSTIFYFMAGFDRDLGQFLVFFSIILVNHYIVVSCAMACVAAVRGFPGASLIANLAFTLQSMACGFFVQIDNIPVYVRWLKWLTFEVFFRLK